MAVRTRLLFACAALAAGEFVASRAPTYAEAWPAAAAAALLVALFGYAWAVRGWVFVAIACAGLALFLCASVERERAYRERPWLRATRHEPIAVTSRSMCDATRRDFSRRVALGLGAEGDLVRLNRAILLGERRGMSPCLKETFVMSGTIHIFAISGLHVMAVARVLMTLLRFVWIPRRFVGTAVIPLLWGYVALIDFPPSAIRAAAMASLACLALRVRRRPDGVTAWALTFLGVYLVRPMRIVDVGCGLSFAVMLAILVAGDWLRDRPESWKKSLAMTFAAWAAGLPIAAHVFGRVTPGGLLANLALVPAAGVTVYAGTAGLLASFVSEPLAAHLNALSALFTKAMLVLSDGVSRLPGANVEVSNWSILVCLEWYAVLGLVCLLRHLSQRRRQLF